MSRLTLACPLDSARHRSAPLASALLVACSGEPTLPAGASGEPDIVLLSVDTLRADHLGVYGYGRDTSPTFDTLARDGVRFSAARSASPWTLPAHTTMLSGQLPETHHVVEDTLSLDAGVPVLPELLQAKGFATGGFVATLYVSRLFHFERGFDQFEDFDLKTERQNLAGEVTAEDVVDKALSWWSAQPPGKPVFLFLHVYDVHYQYDPPAPYSTLFDRAPEGDDARYKSYAFYKKKKLKAAQMQHQVAQYDESIRYVNDQVARVAAAAAAARRKIRWAITADHGEEFGERGSWGHAHTLYNEQLHVPLILSGEGVPAGLVVDRPVGTQDIAPTLAAWAGATGLQADGLDLAALVAGASLPERPFPAETSRFKTNRIGLLEGPYRIEWDLEHDRAEVFDTRVDPAEAKPLADPALLQALQARVEAVWGLPWEAKVAGKVRSTGVILSKGRHTELVVAPGDRFLVMPPDADLHFEGASGVAGPYRAAGGAQPGPSDPVSWGGQGRVKGVELDAQTREMLEKLGYVQGEEEAPAGAPEP